MFEITLIPTAKKQLKCNEESTYKKQVARYHLLASYYMCSIRSRHPKLETIRPDILSYNITQTIHNLTSINMKI